MEPIVTCNACGAKLRLKRVSLRALKQVQCGKCRTKITIPPELKEAAERGTLTTSVPPAPEQPPARAVRPPVRRAAVAPAPPVVLSVSPPPAAAIPGIAAPPPTRPSVIPIAKVPTPAPAPEGEETHPASASPPPSPTPVAAPAAAGHADDRRMALLEKQHQSLQANLRKQCESDLAAARQRVSELENRLRALS